MGALAGLVMFFGAWLSGYYNHWFWPVVSVIIVLGAFWMALDTESGEELSTRAIRGFVMGALAAVVARVLGLVAMAWAYDSWTSPTLTSYDSISDLFRVLLNGNFVSTLIAILGSGVVGAFIAYAMPYFVAEKEDE